MLSEDEMRRLAFIRYLYVLGVEQSRRPEPLAAASILTFHDSIELFLQLTAEHLNVSKKRIEFEEYWSLIESVLQGKRLAERESMRRLNKLRVTLKHDGTFPSPLSIEGFRGSITGFFEVNTPIVFGIEFSDISMVGLVTFEETRNSLADSSRLAAEDSYGEAIEKTALAFAQLLAGYETRARGQAFSARYSPFAFGESMQYLVLPMDDMGRLARSIGALQNAVKVIGMGLDYRRYSKFAMLTPTIRPALDGSFHVIRGSGKASSADAYRFCFDFVIDSALRLQEFEFGV